MSQRHPQAVASDPEISAFVSANAGSGKTKTLVDRVARLLLRRSEPGRILCVTYTKAAAAEMQGRLYEQLGGWSVKDDAALADDLGKLEGRPAASFDTVELQRARALFARALETPGGLKIQTIHAFCEKLLRRFPLEAGVSPRFQVLEDAAAAELSALAREAVALAAVKAEDGPLGRAFAHFAVELDPNAWEALLKTLEARRADLGRYVQACEDGEAHDPWVLCGAERDVEPEAIEAEALARLDPERWAWAKAAMAEGGATDARIAAQMAVADSFERLLAVFCTQAGEPRKSMASQKVSGPVRDWLTAEQGRVCAVRDAVRAARIARDSVHVLTLAQAYAAIYEAEKAAHGGLDFADLIARTLQLLTTREDAAWVLFKLDGGVDHILLDEAQDTAPEQWDILRALTEDLFAGQGARAERGREPPTLFVVGDEKQSIYSFQGARPERLEQETLFHMARIHGVEARAERAPLLTSYRSTPEVLAFADAVFADVVHAKRLTGREASPMHVAHRAGHQGCVDLWPLEQDVAPPERDAWDPVDADVGDSARKRLARAIAREIVGGVERGEAVHAKDGTLKPMGFGDVLILVRKRDALFEEIIRALKQAGAPVAGADRMTLSDHIVFDDLTGLLRWVLFPNDDLTLAALLRSPFCAVDEQSLFDLAFERDGGGLWRTLEARAEERAEWREAHRFFAWALDRSRKRAPFAFLGEALTRKDAEGRTVRARFYDRLGREAEEAIDELMAQALAAESRGARDLEGLLAELDAAEVVVKREMEAARDEVRVMTVHGSKGLEAPIVILPDTTTAQRGRPPALLETERGEFLWAPRAGEDCPASAAARALAQERAQAESSRLLYVALTRARDRLILAGRIPATRGADKESWRLMLEAAFERPEIKDRTHLIRRDDREFTRFGADPAAVPLAGREAASAFAAPDWLGRAATPEIGARWASPSSLGDHARDAAPSPLAAEAGLGRFRRGELIHKLFEVLPELPAEARRGTAERLLGREPDLNADQITEMTAACLAVLDDPRFAPVFAEGSRAEAALAGSSPELPQGMAVSGRMDRLLVTPQRVLVVDYKTNRPAPDRLEDVDPAYVDQLAAYVAVLRELYPDRPVEAALVWTDGPKLTPLPREALDDALRRLRDHVGP